MRQLNKVIPAEYNAKLLLYFLKGELKFSTHIVAVLRHTDNSLLINNKPARVIDKVKAGDRLDIFLPEKTSPPLLCEMELDIIFEDDDLLIINKPAGVAVHPTHNHPTGTLSNGVANYLIKSGCEPSCARAVGRLDKGTSGVIVFAKNSYSASRLNGNIQKIYIAVAYKKMVGSGTIDTPIYRPDKNKTLRATGEADNSEYAVTHWNALAGNETETLLRVTIETGRTHQIRVHLAGTGAPLVGDDMYGGPLTDNMKRPALHCLSVEFNHPVKNVPVTVFAGLPDDIKAELLKNKIPYNNIPEFV